MEVINLKRPDDIIDLKKNLKIREYLKKRVEDVGLRICIDDDGYYIWVKDKNFKKNIFRGMAKKYRSKSYVMVDVRPEGVFLVDDDTNPFLRGKLLKKIALT